VTSSRTGGEFFGDGRDDEGRAPLRDTLALQSFAGRDVIEDFFSVPGRAKPVHIELAKQSDLLLISPATGHLSEARARFADDVLAARCWRAPAACHRTRDERENAEKQIHSGKYQAPRKPWR